MSVWCFGSNVKRVGVSKGVLQCCDGSVSEVGSLKKARKVEGALETRYGCSRRGRISSTSLSSISVAILISHSNTTPSRSLVRVALAVRLTFKDLPVAHPAYGTRCLLPLPPASAPQRLRGHTYRAAPTLVGRMTASVEHDREVAL